MKGLRPLGVPSGAGLRSMLSAVPVLILALLAVGCGDRPSARAVAVVGPHELTVGETVSLLSLQTQLPADPQVIRALAELWTDYTLLAQAALQDSSLAAVDLSSLVEQRVEGELLGRLTDAELVFDTAISDEQLEAAYDAELPGGRVSARHILLSFEQGNAESRDSALALARDLRSRIVAGESFQELAEEYSADVTTAGRGGDLGSFARPDMVPPFSDAAFALQPGEVSEPVETIYGFHIIRTEQREVTPLDSVRDRYRNALQGRRMQTAESLFVASVDGESNLEVNENALEILRSLALNPGNDLSRRAAGRSVVGFEGGSFTARDLQVFVRSQPPAWREQAATAPAEQVEPFLMDLARRKVMIQKARANGYEIEASALDTFEIDARVVLVQAATRLGFREETAAGGETTAEAVDRLVMQSLSDMMAGRAQVVPLGAISHALRANAQARILQSGVQLAVDSLSAWRQTQVPPAAAPPPGPGPAPVPESPPAAVDSAR